VFLFVSKSCTGAATICPAPVTFDLLTLKVVSESRVTWATSVPILVSLGLSVLDLGPMYATDREMSDRRQTASLLNAPAPWHNVTGSLRRCNLKYLEKSRNLMRTGKWQPCIQCIVYNECNISLLFNQPIFHRSLQLRLFPCRSAN